MNALGVATIVLGIYWIGQLLIEAELQKHRARRLAGRGLK